MSLVPELQADAVAVAPARRVVRAWPLIEPIALLGLCCALFALVQFGTGALVDNDGYYHVTMGRLIRERGLTPDFVWLPLTILNRGAFYDHHMLFHVYLALFAGDGRPDQMILGAKIASVIMPSLAFLAVWRLLRAQGIRWAALWTLGLFAVSQAFLFRMSMTRAQSASLLVLILGLHWLLQRRYARLIPLGFVYVWLYNAFPLLLVAAAVYAGAALITERRIEWRALAYPALGIALGLVLNPYFPRDLRFIAEHLAPKIGAPATSVGNEWYPYDTWTLIGNSGLALAAWLLGALALAWRGRRIDRPTLTALALSVAFGFLLFKSRRFVEYFPAFALIFAALSVAPAIEEWWRGRPRLRRLAPFLAAAALALPLGISVAQARAGMAAQSIPAGTYADASRWLAANTPPGSMVFQTDWDDFPLLFFHNTANVYTAGLDPTFMQEHDPALYDEWVKITRGQVARPAAEIRAKFGAAYILTDLQHQAFLDRAKADPRLQEVYRDRYAAIFAVRD